MRFPTHGIFRGLYAFSPTPLLTAVLGRIQESLRLVLLLAPAWPRQPWYGFLVELSVAQLFAHAIQFCYIVGLLTWTPQISTPTSISLEACLSLLIWLGSGQLADY